MQRVAGCLGLIASLHAARMQAWRRTENWRVTATPSSPPKGFTCSIDLRLTGSRFGTSLVRQLKPTSCPGQQMMRC